MKKFFTKDNIINLLVYITLIITGVLAIVLTIIFKYDIFDFFVCITGVLYLGLLANRNFINFIVGIVNVTIYVIVAFKFKLYGEVIFYLIFDLPMAIVSYFLWRKHKVSKLTVESRTLKPKWWILSIVATIIMVFLYGLFLQAIGGQNVYIDALSTIVSTAATLLMAYRFKEQWFMWIVVYIVSTIMWIAAFNPLMIIMSIECVVISILGYFEWWLKQKNGKKIIIEENKNVIESN